MNRRSDSILPHPLFLLVVLLIALVVLGGCSTAAGPEPRIEIQRVEVPVSRPCVDAKVPGRETYADTAAALKSAGGGDGRYHLMAGEWPRRDARLNLLENLLEACR
jgi:hypothetical protein